MPENWQRGGFALYVHWPFCLAKCPYCDFNSHVSADVDAGRWQRAFLSEINRLAEETTGRVLSSIFFGGGTPSLMPPELVGAVIEAARAHWPLANDVEITLEANPTSVEAGRFRAYHDAGVNRVSVGVQALNDADLRALGRLHSVDEARAAVALAQQVFERSSFDLIYARQGQTLDDWRAELDQAVAMSAGHLSLYQLTIEDGTAFGDRFKRGKLRGLPDSDLAADLYQVTQEVCARAGLPAYEVSNHAAPGDESRHNLVYWRSGDWLGIGPGAHGRLTLGGQRIALATPLGPGEWLERVETHGSGELPRDPLPASEQITEFLIMGLRISQGVAEADLFAFPGADILRNKIKYLVDLDLLARTDGRLLATETGRPVLNAVLLELLADLP